MSANIAFLKDLNKNIRILQIEDNLADARLIKEMLGNVSNFKFTINNVTTLEHSLKKVYQKEYDIILLDLSLPDSHGIKTLEAIRNAVFDIPIILLTGENDEDTSLKAIKKGAQDYLLKNQLEPSLLIRSIIYAIDRKKSEVKLTYLAKHDSLTGLANRNLFYDRLEQAIIRSKRSQEMTALMFIDIDHFKSINDKYGHQIGDILLKEVSKRLKRFTRSEDTVARLGGDEFTIILENISKKNCVSKIAEDLTKTISEPFYISGMHIKTSCSIGISMYSGEQTVDATNLIRHTDIAMYRAKQQGRNNFKYFTPQMEKYINSSSNIEEELNNALENNQFSLQYQPQIDIRTEKTIGAEALIRWNHPDKNILQPNEFLPLLEETGLIIKVGEWVLQTACKQWNNWQEEEKVTAESIISVNISAKQFNNRDFHKQVAHALDASKLKPKCLDLEITENMLLENSQKNIKTLEKLKKLGVKISIDDFGTGFSSLNDLKKFPIDCLKIDKSFIENIINNKKDTAISASIINLARNLNLDVVAEGVDQLNKVDLLHEIGCNVFQGNYFGEPLSINAFSKTMTNTQYLH